MFFATTDSTKKVFWFKKMKMIALLIFLVVVITALTATIFVISTTSKSTSETRTTTKQTKQKNPPTNKCKLAKNESFHFSMLIVENVHKV
jgi:hypothetical protein